MNKIKTILIKQKFSFEMKTIWHKYNFKNVNILRIYALSKDLKLQSELTLRIQNFLRHCNGHDAFKKNKNKIQHIYNNKSKM